MLLTPCSLLLASYYVLCTVYTALFCVGRSEATQMAIVLFGLDFTVSRRDRERAREARFPVCFPAATGRHGICETASRFTAPLALEDASWLGAGLIPGRNGPGNI